MSELKIRDARKDDGDAILNVTLAAYQQYAPIMSEFWEEYRQNVVETLADPKPAEQFVAEKDGVIVGSVLLYPAGTVFDLPDDDKVTLPSPEVRLLAVAPSARGQGIGDALMRECIRRARAAGVPALSLHTMDFMTVAKEMYERMGFVRAPETDFVPTEDVRVKGYRLMLGDGAQPPA